MTTSWVNAEWATMNACQDSLVEKYEDALINGSCDIAAFEKVLLYYFDRTTLIAIKEKLLRKHGMDLNTASTLPCR